MTLNELLEKFIRDRIVDLGEGVFGLPAGIAGEIAGFLLEIPGEIPGT